MRTKCFDQLYFIFLPFALCANIGQVFAKPVTVSEIAASLRDEIHCIENLGFGLSYDDGKEVCVTKKTSHSHRPAFSKIAFGSGIHPSGHSSSHLSEFIESLLNTPAEPSPLPSHVVIWHIQRPKIFAISPIFTMEQTHSWVLILPDCSESNEFESISNCVTINLLRAKNLYKFAKQTLPPREQSIELTSKGLKIVHSFFALKEKLPVANSVAVEYVPRFANLTISDSQKCKDRFRQVTQNIDHMKQYIRSTLVPFADHLVQSVQRNFDLLNSENKLEAIDSIKHDVSFDFNDDQYISRRDYFTQTAMRAFRLNYFFRIDLEFDFSDRQGEIAAQHDRYPLIGTLIYVPSENRLFWEEDKIDISNADTRAIHAFQILDSGYPEDWADDELYRAHMPEECLIIPSSTEVK